MIIWAQLWFKVTKWFVKQSREKALIILMSIFLSLSICENYRLHESINGINYYSNYREHRNDSLISLANKKLQECNDKRQSDLEKANLYWNKKFDQLEERLYEDYKAINKIKRK